MSWQCYADSLAAQKVDKCAVCDKNDGTTWAKASDFAFTHEEVTQVAKAIDQEDDSIFCNGVQMGGQKWTVVRQDAEEKVLVLKGKEASNKKHSLVVAVADRALVLGSSSDESFSGAQIRNCVQPMRDHLKNSGY